MIFLSTYPVRGTTFQRGLGGFTSDISIHVPRAGYDSSALGELVDAAVFLSTYPVRGTTNRATWASAIFYISIHVPRAGYDISQAFSLLSPENFYPRTPCGVRQQSVTNQTICFVYLPKTIEAPGKCFSIFPLKWHIMPTNPVRRCLGFRESLTFALEY